MHDKLQFFLMADCGPTLFNYFKTANLFIPEDFFRPGTVHEEKNRRADNDSWWYLVEDWNSCKYRSLI